MNVLIIGGLGFIGSNLSSYLQENTNHTVRVLDNESVGSRDHSTIDSSAIFKCDIRNADEIRDHVGWSDRIVLLAADTTVIGSIENPQFNFDVNVNGVFNVLETMREKNKTDLIFASTGGAICGDAEPPLSEDMPANPLSPYGASKLAAEGYISAYCGSYGFKGTCLRFANVYGPGSYHKGSVVAQYFKSIIADKPLVVYGDGSQTRDFVFVDDISNAIATAIEKPTSGVFQLGSGVETSIIELLSMLQRITNKEITDAVQYKETRPGEVYRTYCDINKARNDLGYAARTNLELGLELTWEWFLNEISLVQKAA